MGHARVSDAKSGVPVKPPRSTLYLRLSGDPDTLDWNRAHTNIETHVLNNLMEGLVEIDSNQRVSPGIAKRWTVSADRRLYTFYLDKNRKWSDGVGVRAQDFVYSWKRLLSKITGSNYSYLLFDIEGAEKFYRGELADFSKVGIQALDDHTFQVTLKETIHHWLYTPTFWATFPLREDIVTKYGNTWSTPGRMVTVGPYALVSRDKGLQIVLKANPFYGLSPKSPQEIIFRILEDNATALEKYKAGELDFLSGVSVQDLARIPALKKDFKAFPYLKTVYLGFILSQYPVHDPHIRKAVVQAIDSAKLSLALFGQNFEALGFIPTPVSGFRVKRPPQGIRFDPTAAKAELKLGGWGTETGKKLKLDLFYLNTDDQIQLANLIKKELERNLGIEIQLHPFDHSAFRARLQLATFPMFLNVWGADFPTGDNFLSVFLSFSGNNWTTWKSAPYDNFILEARKAKELEKVKTLYEQAQQVLLDQQNVIFPLYYEPHLTLIKPYLKGLELTPLNYLFVKGAHLEF